MSFLSSLSNIYSNKYTQVGLQILGAVVPGVGAVEQIATAIPGLKGPAKQDAVVNLVKNALVASESLAGKDLLNDAEVEAATKAVIDAVVAFQNILAKKAATA